MGLRPKNWNTFQHYKDRRPPWIRLYHHLIDQATWWALKGDDAKYLVIIWLIASEHEGGDLPELPDLAFRLRMPLPKCQQLIKRLDPWLERTDTEVLAPRERLATPEAEERQRREETEGEGEAGASKKPAPRAPLAPLPFDSDPEENIPEGLSIVQYRQFACERLQIAVSYTNQIALGDAIQAVARDEQVAEAEATKRVIRRGRDHPPEKGVWRWWTDQGGWKQPTAGVSTEGWE